MNGGNDGAGDSGGSEGGGLAREFAATWLAAPAELVEDGGGGGSRQWREKGIDHLHTHAYTPPSH